jgi:hypothetical protein
MRNSEPLAFPVLVLIFIGIILLLYTVYNDEDIKRKPIEPIKPVDSMIVFRVKPSDKMLIALWDSELDSYVFMKYRADSIAKGIGTTLIHRDDK